MVSNLDTILGLIGDQTAQNEAVITYLVDSARAAKNFSDFQRLLGERLTEVKLTAPINVDEYLASHEMGYVALIKNEAGQVDYYRTDSGLPVIFTLPEFLYDELEKMEVVRVINLQEEHARRNGPKEG